MLTVEIYRDTTLILATKPNDNSNVKQELMGEHILTLQFTLDRMIDLRIGDYAIVYGNTYFIHPQKPPVVLKNSRFGFEYDIQMMATQYLLQNVRYLFMGATNALSEPEFSLNETAEGFVDLLIQNAARLGMNWKKGGVIQTGYKNITFSKVDCLAALGTLAQEFETEWFVEGTTIHLAKKISPTPYIFEYGKGKGMYEIKRLPADSTSVVTRLYVYGGTKNIPLNYRNGSTRLLLPASIDPKLVSNVTYTVRDNRNGTQTMTFFFTVPADPSVTMVTVNMRNTSTANPVWKKFYTAPGSGTSLQTEQYGIWEVYFESLTGPSNAYVSVGKTTSIIVGTQSNPYALLPGNPVAYIENNVDLYGVIEGDLVLDDIYPHRTGKVTAVDATNPFTFIDATLDFNINNQLLPGTAVRVQFNTGQLAGYSFKIKQGGYNPTTKEITLLKNDEEKTLDMPSVLFRPAIGDEYVLVDMVMPQSYISAAETQLLQKAQENLNTYSAPIHSYMVDIDPKWARLNKVKLKYGDVVRIIDTDLGVNRSIRIISVVKQLTDEYDYDIVLGEVVSRGLIQQINSSLANNSNGITNINNSLNASPFFEGFMKGLDTATSLTGLKQLYIDPATGKVYIAP